MDAIEERTNAKPTETARWQVKYGFRNDVDLVYEKYPRPQKPRLPDLRIDKKEWRLVSYPGSLVEFLGNERVVSQLNSLQKGETSSFANYIISGASGTGKKACMELLKQILINRTREGKRTQFLAFDAKTIPEKDFVPKIEEATRRLDPEKSVSYLVIENLEVVPIAIQQHHFLPLLTLLNTKNIYCIVLIRPDANKLPDQLKKHATKLHLQTLTPLDVRAKILSICQQQRVGYAREGIEELLMRCDFRLLQCITALQQIFLSYHYVSLINVRKTMTIPKENCPPSGINSLTPPPYPLSILKMNEPLRRCKLCTLLPVCSHVTMQSLYERVVRTRDMYPTRVDNGTEPKSNQDDHVSNTPNTVNKTNNLSAEKKKNTTNKSNGTTARPSVPVQLCSSYVKRGICNNIQSIGRCRYAHPRQIHTIDTSVLVKRCMIHTLPVPCIHCTRLMDLKHALRLEEIEQEKLDSEIKQTLKQVHEKDMERYLYVREHAKTMKWGSAKREFEERLRIMDTKLQQLRSELDRQKQIFHTRATQIEQLRDDVQRGRTKGMGKGQGKLPLQASATSPSHQRLSSIAIKKH